MAVLTITGELTTRSSVYDTTAAKRNKKTRPPRQKRRKLPARRPKSAITEQQAQMIVDRQIASKLKKMFY